jgi:hypothetical protein
MWRHLLLGMVLLAGCQNIRGPLAPRSPARVDDPRLTIPEQERASRDRFALPDESPEVGPRSGAARPGLPAGR